jgi:hypothetical protein
VRANILNNMYQGCRGYRKHEIEMRKGEEVNEG